MERRSGWTLAQDPGGQHELDTHFRESWAVHWTDQRLGLPLHALTLSRPTVGLPMV